MSTRGRIGSSSRVTTLLAGFAALAALAASGCVTDDELELTQTSQASYSMAPSGLLFADTVVGATSSSQYVTLNPIGYVRETIDLIYSCPDFLITQSGFEVWRQCDDEQLPQFASGDTSIPPQLRPPTNPFLTPPQCLGGTYIDHTVSINVRFKPTGTGNRSCTVTVDSEPSANKTFTVDGIGIPTPYGVSLLTPTSLPLGQVLVGQASSPGVVTLKSTGSQPLSITSVTLTNPSVFSFSSGNSNPHTIAPNATDSWGVVCTPTATGSQTATLTIVNNADDATKRTMNFALSCSGIESNLVVSPNAITFSDARVGDDHSENKIAVTLAAAFAGAPVTFTNASVTGDGLTVVSNPAAGTQITNSVSPANDIIIKFDPIADGTVSGILTVSFSGGSREIPITAKGTMATMFVSADSTIDFGPVCVGESSKETVVASNAGSAPFTVASIAAAGEFFSLNFLAPTVYPAALSTSMAASFDIVATPSEGPQTGTVTILSDIPGQPSREISLTARGVKSGVSIAPSELDFGTVSTGTSSSLQSVNLSNCVPGGLTLISATIIGPDAADFLLVQEPEGATIPSLGVGQWLVEMAPTARGPKTASLEIVHSGGTILVDLSGAGSVDTSDVRGTYYACQAGGGNAAGAGLLLLVVGLVLRPRRRRR